MTIGTIKGVRYEWRLLKLHFAFSTVLLSSLIVDSVSGHALAFGVLIAPAAMEPNACQFHTTSPGRSLAIARLVASQGQAQKRLSHGQCE
jgi:hypothetical protein